MNDTAKLFELAQLAEASYANFWDIKTQAVLQTESDIIAALITSGFSKSPSDQNVSTQASEFLNHWKVVTQQPDTASSFSGTLFQYIGTDPNSGFQNGQYVYSLKGTLELAGADIATDVGDIATDGLALDQIVDMYNDWKRIQAGVGNTYQAAQLTTDVALTAARAAMPIGTTAAYDLLLAAQGYIIDKPLGLVRKVELKQSDVLFGTTDPRAYGSVDLGSNPLVEVTGHSLGGHLAMAFTRLFPGAADAVTINGAGFATGLLPGFGGMASSNIANLFAELGGASQFDTSAIQNIYGDKMPEIVTMDQALGLKQQGGNDALFIEQPTPWGSLAGHGAKQMTDSLAVYDLFICLDSSLAAKSPAEVLAQLKPVFEKASNQADHSLESLVIDLSQLILGTKPTITTDDREALYAVIKNLIDSSAFKSLIGKVTLAAPPTTAAEARSDLGAFLSLYYLTPFTLKTTDAGALNQLYTANKSVATLWNDDRNLTAEQLAQGQGNFSDQWLEDRTKFLGWATQLNTEDKSYGLIADKGNEWTFRDVGSDYQITIGSGIPLYQLFADKHQIVFGSDNDTAPDTLTGGDASDHLYGMGGNDTLNGGAGNDYLEGGTGIDILTGGTGADVLNGGEGVDIYQLQTGDGYDTILDADGQGLITLDNTPLTGGSQVGDSRVYLGTQLDGKQHSYVYLTGNNATGGDLLIDGTLLIKNYQPTAGNGLGLTLGEAAPDNDHATTRDIIGDFAPLHFTSPDGNPEYHYDDLGNIIQDTNAPGAIDDILNGSTGRDHIISGAGNDLIRAAQGGEDHIEAGSGQDTITAGSANDVIEGGSGSDIIDAGAGDDRLYADTQIDVATAIANGNTQPGTGATGDWLNAGNGNDTLIGSTGNDLLAGGAGNDLLIGGAGDDVLLGSNETQPVNYPAKTWHYDASINDIILESIHHNIPPEADSGNDIIYAGQGNDYAAGGYGSDIVLGEGGNDIIRGGSGNDVILGGNDNDTLYGDTADNYALAPSPGNDWLDGGDGRDTLYGNEGEDTLIGGLGDDILHGGAGNDTYIYNKGDGIDHIYDDLTPGANTFKFGAGINASDIILRKGSLLLDLGDGDEIHIEGFDAQDAQNSVSISNFEFADGTTLNTTQLLARGFDLDGADGDDSIIGTNLVDRINGYAGHDTLIGAAGNDILHGGDGNDILAGDADDIDAALHGNDALYGEAGDDTLLGYGGNDTLNGGDGNDGLLAGEGDDMLEGNAGNDTLDAGSGNDTLTGGTGTDQMQGGAGNDTYIFNLGDGQDTLIDASGYNTIQFGEGITTNSITASYNSTTGNLTLAYGNNGNDSIALYNTGTGIEQGLSGNVIQTYRFTDGTQLSHAQLMDTALQSLDYGGTTGNDTITGSRHRDTLLGNDGDDTLAGQDGNDQLTGNSGNDTLDGGTGDDTLDGGTGSDTYHYRLGDGRDTLTELPTDSGTDTLVFGPGITASDLRYIRQDNGNLVIEIANPDPGQPAADSITLANWFNTANGQPNPTLPIERIVFTDGAELTAADLANLPIAAIEGTAGDDTLTGTRYNDTLAGHDGIDSYQLGLGIGADTIIEATDQTSTIQLDAGLALNNANAYQRGNDLAIVLDNGNDSLTLKDYYLNPQSAILTDTEGNSIDADSLVAQTAAQSTDNAAVINKLMSGWLLNARQSVAQSYLNNGYRYAAPGVLTRNDRTVRGSYTETNQVNRITATVNGVTSSWTEHYEHSSFHLDSNTLVDGRVDIVTATLSDNSALQTIQDGHLSSTTQSGYVRADIQWGLRKAGYSETITTTYASSTTGYTVSTINFTYGTASGSVVGFNSTSTNPFGGSGSSLPSQIDIQQAVSHDTYRFAQIIGGGSANEIHGGTAVDGGAGNDALYGNSESLLYGNGGDDRLFDGALMIGGAGNDRLQGGEGGNRYFYTRTGNDSDVVQDSGNAREQFHDWYFAQKGSPHWAWRESGGDYDGWYRLMEGGNFQTMGEAAAYIAAGNYGETTLQEVIANGNLYYVPRQEEFPVVNAHDYATYADFFRTAAVSQDTIEFAAGVAPQDIQLAWTGVDGQVALQIAWNGDRIAIPIPRSWEPIGTGIERFKFADGTVIGMGEMIALAPVHPDFDAQVATLAPDSGGQVFYIAPDAVLIDAALDSATFSVQREELDLVLSGAGSGTLRIAGWYADPAAMPSTRVYFGDGSQMDAATLAETGLLHAQGTDGDDILGGLNGVANGLYGNGGNDAMTGGDGNDIMDGGAGNDVLDGGAGDDTYMFDLGDGVDIVNDTAAPGEGNTLVFGEGITPDDISLGLGSLLLRIGANGDAIHLQNFAPNDALGSHAIENFHFADGTALSYAELLARGIDIDGTADADVLFGTSVADHMQGLDGNDELYAHDGNDTLSGGADNDYLDGAAGDDELDGGIGNDYLSGGEGNDTYVFGSGYGEDCVYDFDLATGGADTVQMTSEVSPADVTVTRDEFNLYLSLNGGADVLTLSGWFSGDEYKIERVMFADSTEWDAAMLESLVTPSNSAPELVNPIPGQIGVENHTFTFQIPAGTFVDPDAGDVLSYSATLANGAALPSWLSLDAATGIFSGTSGLNDAGTLSFIVTATDLGGLSASGSFDLDIANLIQGTQYSDNITGTAGNDYIDAGTGNDTVNAGDGNDTILGGAGSDVLAGGIGDDTFIVEGNDAGYDRFEGDAGYDVIQGGAGDDVIRVSNFSGVYTVEKIDGGAGVNVVAGTQYSDTIDLSGTELVNIAYITGTTGNDTIIGSAGDDTIIGDLGSDVLAGGAGNDTFLVNGSDTGYDRFEGDAGYDVIQGGTGDDTIRVSNFTGLYTVEKIDGGAGSNVIAGTQYSDTIDLSGTELVNIANIDGGLGNDTIAGSVGDDVIIGSTGSDVLAGGAGNDTFLVSGTDTGYDRFEGDAGFDVIQGGAGDDTIRVSNFSGLYTVEKIDGGAGSNVIAGTQYSDSLDFSATELANIGLIDGRLGNDTIIGSAGNDLILGNTGSDVLSGGAGNDTFLVSGTDTGYDRFEGDAGYDAIQGSAGDDVIRVSNFTGIYTVEKIDGGLGYDALAGTQYSDSIDLSNTELANIANIDGGLGNDTMTGSAGDDVIIGGIGSDVLAGGAGNDTFLISGSDTGYDRFEGDAGYDRIQGGMGDDVIRVSNYSGIYTVEKIDGGAGSNVIAGTQYSDSINLSTTELVNIGLIDGGAGNDSITGSVGNDLIQGMSGADVLSGGTGNNLLDGGADNDTITGGAGNELFVGGVGNDVITTGTGYDVIAFNAGSGQDTINASTGTDNTISLGGGIKYSDLSLSKSGNNLILKTGSTDQITLKDWYASTSNHSVLNLQVIAEAMADFDANGSDVLKDNKIETFDFAGLVGAFDSARGANSTYSNWALTNALLDFHLGSGSDTDVIGGDLAYQYGKAGTLSGIGLNAAQSVINAPAFGLSAQTLHAVSTWQAETVKLG